MRTVSLLVFVVIYGQSLAFAQVSMRDARIIGNAAKQAQKKQGDVAERQQPEEDQPQKKGVKKPAAKPAPKKVEKKETDIFDLKKFEKPEPVTDPEVIREQNEQLTRRNAVLNAEVNQLKKENDRLRAALKMNPR